MFKIYNKSYLSEKLGVEQRIFHRRIKPRIIKDFEKELDKIDLKNPDIGLDEEGLIYLVDTKDTTVYIETLLNISAYID